MPPLRAVIFDYGLVLSGPPDPAAHSRMQSILHTTHEPFEAAYWRRRHDYDLGVLNGVDFWRNVAAELQHPLDDSALAALLEADLDLWTQPNQPMIDWALALERSGIRIAILSNIGDEMETGIVARLPWLSGFRHHTFSHRLRIAKPDERIYRHTLDALSVQPDEALFIDDRIENIEAARRIGMHAIHYTSHEDFLRAFEAGNFSGLPAPSQSIARSPLS